MTTRLSLQYNKHLFKPNDGTCPGKLKAQKQKKLLKDLKKELRDARALHKLYRKTANDNIAQLLQQVDALQDELAEEKENALDQLNDRAEVVAELTKRAAPEGWSIAAVLRKDQKVIVRLRAPDHWEVIVYPSNGPFLVTPSFAEAMRAAEAVKIPKAKKAKRK